MIQDVMSYNKQKHILGFGSQKVIVPKVRTEKDSKPFFQFLLVYFFIDSCSSAPKQASYPLGYCIQNHSFIATIFRRAERGEAIVSNNKMM